MDEYTWVFRAAVGLTQQALTRAWSVAFYVGTRRDCLFLKLNEDTNAATYDRAIGKLRAERNFSFNSRVRGLGASWTPSM